MDCSVLELFYGMDYMLFLGFRRLFLLRSSVIVLFSNFLLLFCVYMLSIFLFLILVLCLLSADEKMASLFG